MYGEAGDDIIFGGLGDDTLNGGAGNDYLDGNAGADKLYGEAGNDMIVYDASDLLVSGGDGIDFLIGDMPSTTTPANIVDILSGNKVDGVEVFIDTNLSLTNMDALKTKLGIEVENNQLTYDADNWKVTSIDGTAYSQLEWAGTATDPAADTEIVVLTTILQNQQG